MSTPQEFTNFSISYGQQTWHIKSDNKYFAFSTINTTDFTKYVSSNDISWHYSDNVHYYIAMIEGSGYYKITYEMNGSTAQTASFYNTNSETTLPIPKKERYNFVGWTGANGSVPQIVAKIPKYSRGDKRFVANFEEEPIFAEIYTTVAGPYDAVLKVKDYYPSYLEQNMNATMGTKSFSKFSISYNSPQWHLTTSLDNVYFATSADTPLSEYQKLDTQSWHFTTSVHYYLAIK